MALSTGEQKRHEYMNKPTKLIKLRMKRESSQIETAQALGMSRIHYGNIEKGLYQPKGEIVENIAKHFKATVESIFKKVDEKHYVVKK